MSHLSNAFIGFLSPIQILFRLFCWAPTCRPTDKPIFTNLFCYLLIFALTIFTTLAIFKFHILYLPDDITNQSVVILIELTYIIMLLESFVKQHNYRRIVQHFIQFDRIFEKAVPEVDLNLIYKQWKYLYYQKVFGRLIFCAVFYLSGSLIYFHWRGLKVSFVGGLLEIGKIGIYTKTMQIAFYMDMVYERLYFVEQILLRGQAKQVTTMYALLWQICEDLNMSIGMTLIIFYLQSVIDLVNVSHIMYWNVVVSYTNMETIGVFAFYLTILMPLWDLITSCERCKKRVTDNT